MLSKLQIAGRLVGHLQPRLVNSNNKIAQNLVFKRCSGHNVMNIEPSNYTWKHHKNMVHFYFVMAAIPAAIITTIVNIRANPELTEIPEGYEPRHWEYYKHPITRWMARYMFAPMELEHEMMMGSIEQECQGMIIRKLQSNVEKAMRFYNDHRSLYFRPVFGGYVRTGRDEAMYGTNYMGTNEGHQYDQAYDPQINPVPTEGYKPID